MTQLWVPLKLNCFDHSKVKIIYNSLWLVLLNKIRFAYIYLVVCLSKKYELLLKEDHWWNSIIRTIILCVFRSKWIKWSSNCGKVRNMWYTVFGAIKLTQQIIFITEIISRQFSYCNKIPEELFDLVVFVALISVKIKNKNANCNIYIGAMTIII